jgi:hypothetical protein
MGRFSLSIMLLINHVMNLATFLDLFGWGTGWVTVFLHFSLIYYSWI